MPDGASEFFDSGGPIAPAPGAGPHPIWPSMVRDCLASIQKTALVQAHKGWFIHLHCARGVFVLTGEGAREPRRFMSVARAVRRASSLGLHISPDPGHAG